MNSEVILGISVIVILVALGVVFFAVLCDPWDGR